MESRSAAPAGGPGTEALGDPRRWLILAVICTAYLMVGLDLTVMNLALPSAQEALEFSNSDRQWIVTAYALPFGSLLLFSGRLSDIIGRKESFLIGLTGFGKRLRGRRGRDQLRDAGDGPRLPGRLRLDAGARLSGAAGHHVPRPEGEGQGLRHLQRGRGQRCGPGADPRRRAGLRAELALVHVRQPRLRRRRLRRQRHADAAGAQDGGQAGRPRRGAGVGRHVLPGLRLRQRRRRGLGHDLDVGRPRARRRTAPRLRVLADARRQPAAAAQDPARPQPRRRVLHGAARRDRHVRRDAVPDLLHADQPRLLGDHLGRRAAADGRVHDRGGEQPAPSG